MCPLSARVSPRLIPLDELSHILPNSTVRRIQLLADEQINGGRQDSAHRLEADILAPLFIDRFDSLNPFWKKHPSGHPKPLPADRPCVIVILQQSSVYGPSLIAALHSILNSSDTTDLWPIWELHLGSECVPLIVLRKVF